MTTLAFADRVQETTTTVGTGDYTLLGAVTGFQTFNAGIGVGPTFDYAVTDGTNWEVGRSVLSAPTTLSRTTILASSNGGAAVNWPAGTKNIWQDISAQQELNANLLTATLNNGTLTANAPALQVAQTWNNAAVYFDAVVVNPTNTASQLNGPFYGSTMFDVQVGGASKFAVYPNGIGRSSDRSPTYAVESLGGVSFFDTGGTGRHNAQYSGATGATRWALESGGIFCWGATTADDSKDSGIGRVAAGVTEANNGTKGSYTGSAFGAGSQIVSQLPAASATIKGARSCVTDSTVAASGNFGAIVAGTGTNFVPVYCDGTNWRIG